MTSSASTAADTADASKRHVPVALYVPNLMGYARVILAFGGLYIAQQQPPQRAVDASWIWLASASLDLLDGMMARLLNQCSQFGVLLDIAADNLLRTCFWMAAAVSASSTATDADNQSTSSSVVSLTMVATMIVSLEWTTMICTQLHASTCSAHWKECRQHDPWWIQAIFANNFKSPLGVLCIGGLFGSGYMAWAQTQPELITAIPYFYVLRNAAFVGRGVTMVVEVWLCCGYLAHVIAQDGLQQLNPNKNTQSSVGDKKSN
jgi:phosphatidylglycerophosphate synthase